LGGTKQIILEIMLAGTLFPAVRQYTGLSEGLQAGFFLAKSPVVATL
jgi:hypothetical protein